MVLGFFPTSHLHSPSCSAGTLLSYQKMSVERFFRQEPGLILFKSGLLTKSQEVVVAQP